ncbi:hypothetical protein B0O99DRAFT_56223 [Bisporella sp. PMI_857]|nr:hypothetical protein B0O99DRAFT_56223 [Bisporella sp. PMI_857]
MDQRIATANREGFAFATNLVRSSRLATGTVGAAIARFTGSPLFSQDAFSFKFSLNYQGTTPLKLRSLDKRQAACAVRPSSSLGTTTNAATLGPTATPGNTAGPGQSSTTAIVTQGPSETATIVISTDDPSLTTTIAPSPTSTSTPANVVNSNTLCEAANLNICDASSDGVQRCLALGSPGEDICVATCDAASACPASCTAAGFTFGFCSNGNNPCICSNLAASTGQ